MEKIRELIEEFRLVAGGRSGVVDTLLPPILFVVLNALGGLVVGLIGAGVAALGFAAYRLYLRQPLWYALGGAAGTALAGGVVVLYGQAEGFFLPSLVSGGLTVVVAVVSILVRRPMVAWTSFLVRRWPWQWYWHPQVRPAYTEVTWFWGVYFLLRWGLQLVLFQQEAVGWLAFVNIALGWPGIVLLLIISYLYGTWRLRGLKGPSVEEFRTGAPPPWSSQRRGF